jgi:uncharacterized OB-fold protein
MEKTKSVRQTGGYILKCKRCGRIPEVVGWCEQCGYNRDYEMVAIDKDKEAPCLD